MSKDAPKMVGPESSRNSEHNPTPNVGTGNVPPRFSSSSKVTRGSPAQSTDHVN